MKNQDEYLYKKIERTNENLRKIKGKWEIEGKVSGNYEIPDNILGLEGIEYLRKLNLFDEVPLILSYCMPSLVEYNIVCHPIREYSKEQYEKYVKEGTELIEGLIQMYKDIFGIEHLKNMDSNIDLSINMFINCLSGKINKSGEYEKYLFDY